MNFPILAESFVGGGTIAAYRVVKFDGADNKVVQAAAAEDLALGVSGQLGCVANEPIDVRLLGATKIEFGGNVTRGDRLTWDSVGRGVTAAGANVRCIGIALESGDSGTIGTALLSPGLLHVDAA